MVQWQGFVLAFSGSSIRLLLSASKMNVPDGAVVHAIAC
jgi:hypothetical protein